jgi:ferredoxin-type protein NapH
MERQRLRSGLMLAGFLAFPVVFYYLSPVIILMGASEGIVTGSALVFAGLFLSSLMAGRLWCGWVCPAGGFQDQCARIRSKRYKGGRLNYLKYAIWVPWAIVLVAVFATAGGIKGIDPFYMTFYGISLYEINGIVTFLLVAIPIAAMAIIGSRRAFCHYVCWMAPFMTIGMRLRDFLRLPGLRLRADGSKCISCGKCTRNCPMSLDVEGMVREDDFSNSECVMCGTCVDGCPKSVVEYYLGRPGVSSYA